MVWKTYPRNWRLLIDIYSVSNVISKLFTTIVCIVIGLRHVVDDDTNIWKHMNVLRRHWALLLTRVNLNSSME